MIRAGLGQDNLGHLETLKLIWVIVIDLKVYILFLF
jgi:hypothetical protein